MLLLASTTALDVLDHLIGATVALGTAYIAYKARQNHRAIEDASRSARRAAHASEAVAQDSGVRVVDLEELRKDGPHAR